MNFPISISIVFGLITFTTLFLLYQGSHRNKKMVFIVSTILALQGVLAYFAFYSKQPLTITRIPLAVAPSFIILSYTLLSNKGKLFIKSLDIKTLTLLHTIRIPVEIVLFLLFTYKGIPEIMTFEGRNLDILAGITAPIVYYFTFVKNKIGPKGLLVWNVIGLALLTNIIVHAILSFETPFQQFGLNQPNRALLYFPFIWLPSVVVPIVFFSHCAAIQRLLSKK